MSKGAFLWLTLPWKSVRRWLFVFVALLALTLGITLGGKVFHPEPDGPKPPRAAEQVSEADEAPTPPVRIVVSAVAPEEEHVAEENYFPQIVLERERERSRSREIDPKSFRSEALAREMDVEHVLAAEGYRSLAFIAPDRVHVVIDAVLDKAAAARLGELVASVAVAPRESVTIVDSHTPGR